MIDLLIRTLKISTQMSWLKTIYKAIAKRDKLRDKFMRQNYVVTRLVQEYKKRYPEATKSEVSNEQKD